MNQGTKSKHPTPNDFDSLVQATLESQKQVLAASASVPRPQHQQPESAPAHFPFLTPSSNPLVYQSPLMQAAFRQQQLQLLSHIASLSPFLNNPLLQNPAFVSSPATTTSNEIGINAYAEYVAKLAAGQQQQQRTSTETSSTTSLESLLPNHLLPLPPSLLNVNQNVRKKHNSGQQDRKVSTTEDKDISSSTKGPSPASVSSTARRSSNTRDLTGNRVFTCQICNRSFGYKHVLQNHERTHTGEKPFKCKVCNKCFTRDHHLKTHMRLHTGEKPYSCTHCDKQFVQVANLRRHLRVHTGEKPYKCEECNISFSDSNQLKTHVMIHNGEKPFECTVCHGSFRRKQHLMTHNCSANTSPTEKTVSEETDSEGNSTSSSAPENKRRQRKMQKPTKWTKSEENTEEDMEEVQTEPEDLSNKAQSDSPLVP